MERRAEPRFNVASNACLYLPDDPTQAIPCFLTNVSAGGVRVWVNQGLPFGQPVVIDLEHHLVAAEMRNSQQVGEKFEIGLQRLRAVSKLDRSAAGGAQVLELMVQMGWRTAAVPAKPDLPQAAPPLQAVPPAQAAPSEPVGIEIFQAAPPLAPPPSEPVGIEIPQAVRSERVDIESHETVGPPPLKPQIETSIPAKSPAVVEPRKPEAAPAVIEFARPVEIVSSRKKRWPAWTAAAAGLVLAIAGVTTFTRLNSNARASARTTAEQRPAPAPVKIAEETPAPATPAVSPAPAVPASPVSTAPPAAAPPVSTTAPVTTTSRVTTPPVRTAAPPPIPAASTGHTFVVTAREPAWLGVSADGKPVFQKMLGKGESKQLEFSRIAYVHIGNSSNVDVTLDSHPVGPFAAKGALRLLELTASGARVLPWSNGDPVSPGRSAGSSAK